MFNKLEKLSLKLDFSPSGFLGEDPDDKINDQQGPRRETLLGSTVKFELTEIILNCPFLILN